ILARDPSKIHLNEILHALEGACCLVECVDDEDYCDKIPFCATYEIWKKASQMLKDYFKSVSLTDLIKIAEEKESCS
ncbi:MAG: RrF2 family transcriptional regulator, partial [Candidatus Aminicenantaceae bacterium]